MQSGAMHPRALCVPQANGVVRGTGDKGTRGQAGLITVLHFRVDLKGQREQRKVEGIRALRERMEREKNIIKEKKRKKKRGKNLRGRAYKIQC